MGFRDRFKKKKAIIERKEITIVGAGAEGTALTIPLSAAHIINLYARNRELANSLREKRENETYLPGIKIPDRVRIFDESTTNLKELWARSYCTIFAVPSYALRPTLERFEGLEEEEGIAVAISKGIESETLCPPLDILRAKSGKKVRCVFISFVGFARDTAEGVPVTGVLASKNKLLLNELATVLNVANLQILKSRDETGVQLGSALKNV